jgi:hypothetical protein
MADLETDYLVVGAGASGMAFTDAILTHTDARVVLVDRRHLPGGHWLDAYPFVRVHQPSANYGVASRPLGQNRIDDTGPNAGFYERSTSAEICDYYARVLHDDFLPSGRVRFFGMSDYRGEDADGHRVTSLLTGADTTVRARKIVDATYVESAIPSRHTPTFSIDPGVRMIPPNDLVDLAEPADGFTILGSGKTAMDTCVWLLENGVDPDHTRWIRPRDAWTFDRTWMQPLDLVGAYMQMQGHWVRAAAAASDGADFLHRLEEPGVLCRVDPDHEPSMFFGATISRRELEQLRSIERVVRGRHVVGIGGERVVLDDGEIPGGHGEVYVDCTASGVPATVTKPVFEPGRVSLLYVTIGIVPWSAWTVGVVEALREDDAEKNRLCPPLSFGRGRPSDTLDVANAGMLGIVNRGSEPDLAALNEACRLNPAGGAAGMGDDARVAEGFAMMVTHIGDAMDNLARLTSVSIPDARNPEATPEPAA